MKTTETIFHHAMSKAVLFGLIGLTACGLACNAPEVPSHFRGRLIVESPPYQIEDLGNGNVYVCTTARLRSSVTAEPTTIDFVTRPEREALVRLSENDSPDFDGRRNWRMTAGSEHEGPSNQ